MLRRFRDTSAVHPHRTQSLRQLAQNVVKALTSKHTPFHSPLCELFYTNVRTTVQHRKRIYFRLMTSPASVPRSSSREKARPTSYLHSHSHHVRVRCHGLSHGRLMWFQVVISIVVSASIHFYRARLVYICVFLSFVVQCPSELQFNFLPASQLKTNIEQIILYLPDPHRQLS
ncbi:hypothetical protein EDB89DRAFT_1010875 [Lactarius sanguifluus]|nr:hypothetical protein EDB89DRAFT_1010875 [Lactarius sanguifluus]